VDLSVGTNITAQKTNIDIIYYLFLCLLIGSVLTTAVVGCSNLKEIQNTTKYFGMLEEAIGLFFSSSFYDTEGLKNITKILSL